MIDQDLEKFSALVGDVLGFYRQDCSSFAVRVWWQAMKPFDFAAVSDAMGRHCVDPDRGQFAPKPADIIRLLQGGSKDSAAMAWAKLDKSVRSVGTYSSVVFDDPIIHACVSDLGGWIKLGQTSETEWPHVARRFETLYQGYRLRGTLPTYPPVLTGIAQSENAMRGLLDHTAPSLIGDPAQAEKVMRGGSNGGMLQVTQYTPKALAHGRG